MLELLNTITSNPYADIVVVLSVLGALGFIIFFWGFSGFILAHGDNDHQVHARVQMLNGLTLFFAIFALWEAIRFVLGLFQ